jgi:hypothetical protein
MIKLEVEARTAEIREECQRKLESERAELRRLIEDAGWARVTLEKNGCRRWLLSVEVDEPMMRAGSAGYIRHTIREILRKVEEAFEAIRPEDRIERPDGRTILNESSRPWVGLRAPRFKP